MVLVVLGAGRVIKHFKSILNKAILTLTRIRCCHAGLTRIYSVTPRLSLVCCRDLPQYGQKQWQSYFGRTFDVYTKLWKFQQQHR